MSERLRHKHLWSYQAMNTGGGTVSSFIDERTSLLAVAKLFDNLIP